MTKTGLSLLQGINWEIPIKQWPWFPANLFSNRKFCIVGERNETRTKSLYRENRAELSCRNLSAAWWVLATPSAFPDFSSQAHPLWEVCFQGCGLSQCPSRGSFPKSSSALLLPIQIWADFIIQSHSCYSRSGFSPLFWRNWCMECSGRHTGLSFEGSLPVASGVLSARPFIIPWIPCRHLQECWTRIKRLFSLSLRFCLVQLGQTFFP